MRQFERPVDDLLAPARSFAGGDRWHSVMTEQAIPLLPAEVRDRAARAADNLAALPRVDPVLNRGDLAGDNILWDSGRVTGVLDWDLAVRRG